jgi:Fic family protein
VRDAMRTLCELMKEEENAIVRAILGHFVFVYIHPYMDGNGRTARFIMNSMLVTGGYDWVIIPTERREEYMRALEIASVENDITKFCEFIATLLK